MSIPSFSSLLPSAASLVHVEPQQAAQPQGPSKRAREDRAGEDNKSDDESVRDDANNPAYKSRSRDSDFQVRSAAAAYQSSSMVNDGMRDAGPAASPVSVIVSPILSRKDFLIWEIFNNTGGPYIALIGSYLTLKELCIFPAATRATSTLWKHNLVIKDLFNRFRLVMLLNTPLRHLVRGFPNRSIAEQAIISAQTRSIRTIDGSFALNPISPSPYKISYRNSPQVTHLELITMIRHASNLTVFKLDHTAILEREDNPYGRKDDAQPIPFSALLEAFPPSLRELHLKNSDIGDAEIVLLANSRVAEEIKLLDLTYCWNITDVGMIAIANSPYLTKIETLKLPITARMTENGMQTLLHSRNLSNITSLAFDGGQSECHRDWLTLIAISPSLRGLKELYVDGFGLTAPSLKQLESSKNLGNLTLFHLSNAELISPSDLTSLLESANMSQLTDLSLINLPQLKEQSADAVPTQLPPFSKLTHLQRLTLRLDIALTDTHLLQWIASLDKLVYLDLSENEHFENAGLEVLIQAVLTQPIATRPLLQTLQLDSTGITNEALQTLSGNPVFPQLTFLSLAYNKITRTGLQGFLQSPYYLQLRNINVGLVGIGGAYDIICGTWHSLNLLRNSVLNYADWTEMPSIEDDELNRRVSSLIKTLPLNYLK